jgi:hypothetical protein
MSESKRAFYRYKISITVVSESPMPDDMRLEEVVGESGHWRRVLDWDIEAETIGGKEAADTLTKLRSEPATFELNDEGEDDDG